MGVNMYPSASLLGNHKDESIAGLPVEELIEKADGFAGVFPGGFFFPHLSSSSYCVYVFYQLGMRVDFLP